MTMKKINETLRVSNVVKNHRRIQIDKRLDAYSKLILFRRKLEKANRILSNSVLPS